MRILLDMDGVLTDFMGSASKILGIPLSTELFDSMGHDRSAMRVFRLSANEFWKHIDAKGEGFWANLAFMSDALELLKVVEGLRTETAICSTPSSASFSASGKLSWIKKNLPKYERKYILTPLKSYCATSDTILIDDSDDNCNEFRQAGGAAILMPRPWNSLHTVKEPIPLVASALQVYARKFGKV